MAALIRPGNSEISGKGEAIFSANRQTIGVIPNPEDQEIDSEATLHTAAEARGGHEQW